MRPVVFLSLWHLTFTAVYQHHNTPTPTLATSDGSAVSMMAKKRLSNALLYSKSIAKLERKKNMSEGGVYFKRPQCHFVDYSWESLLGISDLRCWQTLSLNKIFLNFSSHNGNLGLKFLPSIRCQTAGLKENSEGSTYWRILNSRVGVGHVWPEIISRKYL